MEKFEVETSPCQEKIETIPNSEDSSGGGGEKNTGWKRCMAWKMPCAWNKCIIPVLVAIVVWISLSLIIQSPAIHPVMAILFVGLGFGELVHLAHLPQLLGFLIAGMVFRVACTLLAESDSIVLTLINVQLIDTTTSGTLRQLALLVILIRAGLGLDPVALKKLKGVVIRLAFCPCLAEAVTVAVAAHFILNFPWLWGLILGFVLGAVSPAVIVPSLLGLKEKGYGVDKGIPTIVIAASSLDDILAISAFGIVLGVNFASGESIFRLLLQGPLEVLIGVVYGLFWGALLGILFHKENAKSGKGVIIRIILMLGGSCLAIFGSQRVGFPGSGALACLLATFVAAVFWRRKGILHDDDEIAEAFSWLWFIFQPLLFGLIGCEIDLLNLNTSVVVKGILVLAIGLSVRLVVTFFTVGNSGMNFKERIFVSVAWIPKATVQAAIGPIALDTARSLSLPREEELGLQVLTIAALVILITAPIGAAALSFLGPRLLTSTKHTLPSSVQSNEIEGHRNDSCNSPRSKAVPSDYNVENSDASDPLKQG